MTETIQTDQIPLTEATFLILLSLASGSRHGYAIQKDVKTLSVDRVFLSTGTLYGALKRLVEQGWIERLGEDGSEEGGRPRKEYRLSEQGRRIFNAEAARLQHLVQVIQMRRVGGEL